MRELPDYGRGHNLDGDDCWCNPTIEEHENGRLIIHNDPSEAAEEAQRILNESEPFELGET